MSYGDSHSRFYVPETFRKVLEKFREIAEREGRSASEILRELIREYVRRHEPGNPQRTLDPVLEEEGYEESSPCCSYCAKEATYRCFLQKERFGVCLGVYCCDVHRDWKRKVTRFYGEKKL